MRKIIFALFLLAASPAWAGVPCTLPFNLTNGTLADATQVMANYNALVTCLGSAATAGANSDITSLNGITTPIPLTAGGTPTYIGGTSGGSPGALTVSTVPTFILQAGSIVTFIAGQTPTGPWQINVGNTGLKNVFRHDQNGPNMTVGGEIRQNDIVTIQYDGTEYQCMSCGYYLVGEIKDYAGVGAPRGWLAADGSCQSQTTFAELFAFIGTNFGSCGAGLFALPDLRGNASAGLDNQGTNGNAGRLSICGNDTTLGALCGVQNRAIAQANIPVYDLPYTDPGHSHAPANGITSFFGIQVGDPIQTPGSGSGAQAFGLTGVSTVGITVHSGGSGTALTTIQPVQFVYKIIKY